MQQPTAWRLAILSSLVGSLVSAETITMNATIRFTDTDDNLHSAQGIRVEFWDNDGSFQIFSEVSDDLLGTAQTDSNGLASLTVENVDPDDSGTIDWFVRVTTVSDAASVHRYSIPEPNSLWFTTGLEDIVGPTAEMQKTIGNPVGGSEQRRSVHVHQAIQFMYDYATDSLGATVPIEMSTRYDDGVSSSGADANHMHVRGTAYDEWDVIHHEYAHVISHNNGIHDNTVTKSHAFGQDNIGPHGAEDGTRLAWDEGVATYLALAAQQAGNLNGVFGNLPAGYGDEFYDNDPNNLHVSIEDASGSVGQAAGEGDELSVMRILWDIYDNDVESYGGGDSDKFAVGDSATFDLMKNNFTLHALWQDAVEQLAPTYQQRGELGEIFQEYNVSAIPTGPVDGANFDPATIQFSFAEQNSGHSDQFKIVVFNSSFEYIVDESPMLDSNTTQWTSDVKFLASQFHWVVLSDSVADPGGGDPLTDFYWSGANGFFIDFQIPDQIRAVAGGNPDPDPLPGNLTNGSFQVTSLTGASDLAGDGIDDQTSWVFDFTQDPNFRRELAMTPLDSAVLTLRLKAGDAGIADDVVMIDGLDPIANLDIQALMTGESKTVQVELLDHYSSDRILAILSGGVFGQLPFTMTDDAILSFASLDMFHQRDTLSCDFDGNSLCDGDDIDMLTAETAAGSNNSDFDLTTDGLVNLDDIDQWRALAGEENLGAGRVYLVGDANLDGTTDGADFLAWNAAKFSTNTDWTGGNFNGDRTTDGADFLLWNANKFLTADLTAVPEPTADLLSLWVIAVGIGRRRSSRRTGWGLVSAIRASAEGSGSFVTFARLVER